MILSKKECILMIGDDMKNKNGFTLVELLAVIAILGILMVFAVPELLSQLKKSKEDALNRVKDIVISAAKNYVSDYELNAPISVSITDLCDEDYLECPVKNPVTDTNMTGYVIANKLDNYMYVNTYIERNITNLVKNGGMENGTEGFSSLSLYNNISTNDKYEGNASLYTETSNRWTGSTFAIDSNGVNIGDVIYISEYVNVIEFASDTSKMYMGFSNANGIDFVVAAINRETNGWEKISALGTISQENYTGSYAFFGNLFHKDNESATVNKAYIDNLLAVNLTTTFGKGNEPSKEWCDKNLSYFDGMSKVYIGG